MDDKGFQLKRRVATGYFDYQGHLQEPNPAFDRMETQSTPDPLPELSHVDVGPGGAHARMVDVSAKSASARTALARACLRFPAGVLAQVLEGRGPKGPIEEVARVAGILAAKKTAELIPMCHPLGLEHVEIRFERGAADVLEIRCRATCQGRTGVEMEALTGASLAALTVYDMTKALSKGIVIECVELLEKSGGKSGDWKSSRT